MRTWLLLSLVTGFLVLAAPAASAQSWDDNSCSAEFTSCDGGNEEDPTSSGETPCNYNITNCRDCEGLCCCTFKNNWKKCKGGQICQRMAVSEKNACYTNCYTDFEGWQCNANPALCMP